RYLTSVGDYRRATTASIDLVYAGDTIDRVPNTDLLFDEFHRVLKPGAMLALILANVDAYHYRVRGEPYTPGADRPAAMGYSELLAYLAPRFDLIVAHGYNRSYHDELDTSLADGDFARGWAGLHPARPDLGSGVVV